MLIRNRGPWRFYMIRAAIVFFVLSLIAFLFGAYGIAGISWELGEVILMIFLALAALSFAGALINKKNKELH